MRLTMESDFINTIVWILLILLPEALGQQWSFSFPQSIQALKGSCVEIPCSYTRPRTLRPPKVTWYLEGRKDYYTVFDSHDRGEALDTYRSRTKLVLNTINSCTLHISNVRSDDEGSYIPEVDNRDAYDLNGATVRITVIDTPSTINLQGPAVMMEGIPVAIRCSVEHTCGSDPPTLRWNKRQYLPRTEQQHVSEGRWEAISEITYSPTYEDDETEIQCSATYPNGQTSHKAAPLNIIYPPKNITVLIRQKEIQEEDDVTLSCFSKSKLEINGYQWFKGVEKIRLSDIDQEITVRNVSWLTEPYSCSALNSQGMGESALTLIPVQYAPKEVLIVKYEREDGGVVLKCNFSSSRPNVTQFTWLRNDVPIINQTAANITLENVKENAGEYRCIAHNKVGNSSSDEQVAIQFKGTTSIDLPAVLGSTAAVIGLVLIILIIYCCISTRKKKSHTDTIFGTIPVPSMAEAPPTKMADHVYDTLTEGKYHATTDSQSSTSPLNVSSRKSKAPREGDEDSHYYAADDKAQEEPEDINYAAIRFDQSNEASREDGRTEHTVYAILKN
ncbi:B-cell receptor CD22 isoform X1 [Xenopus tropicalis]|uniref:B-cell receptor CD22 isoform X1 n=1 Tax=Xenopus tropicalis TaxID=8364 RepID=A0A8J1JWQ1_XENTR|nr:B-cell receptor CD22 isoform X1 [Xenopus tropicalis]